MMKRPTDGFLSSEGVSMKLVVDGFNLVESAEVIVNVPGLLEIPFNNGSICFRFCGEARHPPVEILDEGSATQALKWTFVFGLNARSGHCWHDLEGVNIDPPNPRKQDFAVKARWKIDFLDEE